MDYFVIAANEDGDVAIERLTKSMLEFRLNEKYWGNLPLKTIPFTKSIECCTPGVYIIKGECIIPRTVTVATRYEV